MIDPITVSKAADQIFGNHSGSSTKALQRLVALKDQGPFPGARKLDPSVANSPILIPMAELKAYIAKNKKAK